MVDVRRALPADADRVWSLVSDFATSFRPERDAFDGSFARLLARDDSFLAVAQRGDLVIGYVLASRHDTLFANAPVVWVEELAVEESERRAGAGRALMTAAEAWAGEGGAVYVSLATRRAREVYLALGYEESATFFKKNL